MKARDIEQKYPPEKAKQLMAALRARNLFYWDEDFPGDEEVGERPNSVRLGCVPQKGLARETYTNVFNVWVFITHVYFEIYICIYIHIHSNIYI